MIKSQVFNGHLSFITCCCDKIPRQQQLREKRVDSSSQLQVTVYHPRDCKTAGTQRSWSIHSQEELESEGIHAYTQITFFS